LDKILASLLLDLTDLSDKDAEQLVFENYSDLYLDSGTIPRRIGVRKTHDDEECIFTESRFVHAFFFKERYAKDKFSKARGARVKWIGQIIAGAVQGTECWRIPPKGDFRRLAERQSNRLYLLRDESYVVWLEPGKGSRWWFSSAYVAGYGDIRRYCESGTQIWLKK